MRLWGLPPDEAVVKEGEEERDGGSGDGEGDMRKEERAELSIGDAVSAMVVVEARMELVELRGVALAPG